ncbi:hypothetical protein D0B54_11760 [Solimonas sp. K1W22B-7]|nr:hypothetical protein D0B54_11760 [Solimonas sp. K1W22B-7]
MFWIEEDPVGSQTKPTTRLATPLEKITLAGYQNAAVTSGEKQSGEAVVGDAFKRLLKLLGFGFVGGILLKLMGRSFFMGFVSGVALEFLLVLTKIMKY